MTQSTRRRLRATLLAGVAVCALAAAGCDEADIVGTETLVERAQEARSKGDLPAAAIDLKAALQQEPDSAAAHFLLGQIYLDIGDGASAEKEFTRARDGGSNAEAATNALAQAWILMGEDQKVLDGITVVDGASGIAKAATLCLRGEAFLGLHRIDEAEQSFDEALTADPGSIAAMVGRARVALRRGDAAEATARLEPALKQAPDDRIVILAQGDIAFASNDYATSTAAYQGLATANPYNLVYQLGLGRAQTASGDLEGGIRTLDQVLQAVPNHRLANLLRGFAAFNQGDYEGTLRYSSKVLNVDKSNLPAVFLDGAASYALGNLEQAHTSLLRVFSAAPKFELGSRLLAATQLRLDQPEQAAETLEALIDGMPADSGLLTMLGFAKLQAGDLASGKDYFARAAEAAPQDAQARLRVGLASVDLGETDAGLADIDEALELDPDLDMARYAKVRTLLRSKAFDEAYLAAKEWHDADVSLPLPLVLMGMAKIGLGDTAAGEAHFEEALAAKPGDVNATNALGTLEFSRGNRDRARSLYLSALDKNPDNLSVLLRLADIDRIDGRLAEAKSWLEQAVGAYPEFVLPRVYLARVLVETGDAGAALEALRPVEEAAAADTGFLEVRGRAQMATNSFSEALDTFDRLAALRPDAVSAQVYRAQALAVLGRAPEAVDAYKKALDINPDHMPSLFGVTRILLAGGAAAEARTYVDRLRNVAGGTRDFFELEGDVAVARAAYADAVRSYEQAHTMSGSTLSVVKLARAQASAGDPALGLQTIDTWVQGHPDDLIARFELGTVHLNATRYAEAASVFQGIVERTPDSVTALNNLAWSLAMAGDFEGARQYAEHANSVDPRDPVVADTLGFILLELGQSENALPLLRQASEVLTNDPSVSFHLAKALAALKKEDEARTILTALLAAPITFPERDQAEQLAKDLGP